MNSVPTSNNTRVEIVDVEIPFLSMVVLWIKVALAAIPAMFILAVIGVFLAGVLGGLK